MNGLNRFQILHRTIAGGNIAVVLSGLSFGGSGGITLNVILMFFVLILLRIKFWFDDEQYLEDVKTGILPGGVPYYFGAGIAVLSWLVWYLAGFFIKDIPVSGLFMAIVMCLSTIWIVAAMVRSGAYAEQVPWLFFNAFYILGFLLLYFRSRSWNPFVHSLNNFTMSVIIGIGFVLLFDWVTTRILERWRKKT